MHNQQVRPAVDCQFHSRQAGVDCRGYPCDPSRVLCLEPVLRARIITHSFGSKHPIAIAHDRRQSRFRHEPYQTTTRNMVELIFNHGWTQRGTAATTYKKQPSPGLPPSLKLRRTSRPPSPIGWERDGVRARFKSLLGMRELSTL